MYNTIGLTDIRLEVFCIVQGAYMDLPITPDSVLRDLISRFDFTELLEYGSRDYGFDEYITVVYNPNEGHSDVQCDFRELQ